MIVATAGHIDHGKTTLVRALTGVDTDRLPEEKARGISIDIGFAHCRLPDGQTIGFVDVPGHERFVRNMLSGVYAVDHVLLVVAADDGLMPQTHEHLHILELLSVRAGTVVITKSDRVDAERLAQVETEVRNLLQGGALHDAAVISVSAVNGGGMDALRGRLARAHAATLERHRAGDLLPRFVVDRVFSAPGSGTVVTGTVISGSIRHGDELVITPAGTPARVRKLQRHGQAVARAQAGERCAINLAQVEQSAVARGDWLVAPPAHRPTDRIDVRVKVLASEGGSLNHWTPVHLHIGAADVPARLTLQRGASVAPGAEALAQLRLDRTIHAAHGDRFILRDQSATRTIGGGMVLDPFPAPARRRRQRQQVLCALDRADPAVRLQMLLDESRDGVDLDWFERVCNLPPQRLQAVLPRTALVVDSLPRRALGEQWVERLHAQVLERLDFFHRERTGATGMEMTQLQRELAPDLQLECFVAVMRRLAAHGRFVLAGSQLRLQGHDSTDNPRDRLVWQKIAPILQDAAASIPSVRELSAMAAVPLQQVRDLMHRKSASGELVKLTHERFAMPATMDMLALKAREIAQRQPGGLFTAAQYRDAIGTGRGLAIEILECLDKRGATQRRGEGRCCAGTMAAA